MNNIFEEFLDKGTERIEQYCASNKASTQERNCIVEEFTNELWSHIGDTSKMQHYDMIIYAASARYNDQLITQLLAKKDKNLDDINSIISLCERLQSILLNYNGNGWPSLQLTCSDPLRIKAEKENDRNLILEENERIAREKQEQAERAERERQERIRREEKERQERIRREEEERLLREKKEEELRQQEIECKKRKRRKAIIFSISILVMMGLAFLYFSVLAPELRYKSAVQMFYTGNYDQAILEFKKLKDYRDSETRIQQIKASQLYDNGNLAGAYEIYSQLGAQYNQHIKEYGAYYAQATKCYEDGQVPEAFEIFFSLGDYSDSREKTERIGKELASNYESAQNFASASYIYMKLDMDEQAKEANYQQAMLLAKQGDYQSASDIWLSDTMIAYKDSRKCNYDMAISIQNTEPEMAARILQKDIDYAESKQALYQIAKEAKTNGEYVFAIEVFDSIIDYKDSADMQKEMKFVRAAQLYAVGEYNESEELFASLGDYKSADRDNECNYQTALLYMTDASSYSDACQLFTNLGDYKDSADKAKECMYLAAGIEEEKGRHAEAYDYYVQLGNYKDSETRAKSVRYQQAKELVAEKQYSKAAEIFKAIADYEDSEVMAKECDYLNANELIIAGQYEDAIELLTPLIDYKEATEMISIARSNLAEQYEKAEEYNKALDVYQSLGNYQGAPEKVLEMRYQIGKQEYQGGDAEAALSYLRQATEYSETKTLILEIALDKIQCEDYQTAEAAYLILSEDEEAIEGLYNIAITYQQKGKLNDAIRLYTAVGRYKDAETRKHQTENLKINEMTQTSVFDIGNTFIFGHYEQDTAKTGKEPIEWLIVDINESNILLVSKYAIDCQKYNESEKPVRWNSSSIRTWLNSTFFTTAFSSEEQDAIVKNSISNQQSDGNPKYSGDGPVTKDCVYLLSYSEVEKYFPNKEDRKLMSTAYAKEHGVEYNNYIFHHGGNTCCWLTRSPGRSDKEAAMIDEGGGMDNSTPVDNEHMGIRPALWINTDSSAVKEAAFAIGSTVVFGQYGDKDDETYEGLRWIVIGKDNKKAELLAEAVVDNKQFQKEKTKGITWENSDLRFWLNHEFIDAAFNSDEQKAMCRINYSLSSEEGVDGYYQIQTKVLADPVILLSYNEIKKIFGTAKERRAKSTSYAKKNGAADFCNWWLLSPGKDNVSAACINGNGDAVTKWATDKIGVRPVIMIDLRFGLE